MGIKTFLPLIESKVDNKNSQKGSQKDFFLYLLNYLNGEYSCGVEWIGARGVRLVGFGLHPSHFRYIYGCQRAGVLGLGKTPQLLFSANHVTSCGGAEVRANNKIKHLKI